MAQLLNPTAPGTERISQILPTVKCSSCNQPVPISELGDHVCPPLPPAFKPPGSPRSPAFLAQKYQDLVSPRSQSPAQHNSPTSPKPPSAPAPLRQPSPLSPQKQIPQTAPLQPRQRAPSTSSNHSLRDAVIRSQRASSASNRSKAPDSSMVAFPSKPGPSESPRVPSPLSSGRPSHPSEPYRTTSPLSISSRNSSEHRAVSPLSQSSQSPLNSHPTGQSNGPMPSRARAPSNASLRPVQQPVRQPVQSSPTPYVPPPMMRKSPAPSFDPGAPRPRAVTNTGTPPHPPHSPSPDIFYSTSNSGPPPSNYLNDPRARTPSNASSNINSYGQSSPGMSTVMSPGSYAPQIEVDTKIGGEAGMAGVGRRGFAAAARAAMFANNISNAFPSPAMNIGMNGGEPGMFRQLDQVHGMDGRRANAPRFLDIASAVNYSGNTPPLSPNSASSHSPHSPLSATLPSPSKDGRTSVTPTPPAIASRTPSPPVPGRPFLQHDRVLPPALDPPKDPLPATPSSPSVRLPFFEKFKNKHPTVDTTLPPPPSAEASPLSPTSSESSIGGLAYADSSDEEDEVSPPTSAPAIMRQPSSASTVTPSEVETLVAPPKSADPTVSKNKVRFPSMESRPRSILKRESKYGPSPVSPSPRLPQRSLSSSTATSTYSVRSAAKSTGALDRAMETLFEEDATSPTVSSNSSPAVFPLALADGQRDSLMKSPKLPVRSHTSPTLGRPDSRHGAGKRRAKFCAKCDKKIDDGRWIAMEGGSVLCDKCWKNMYLPKCRRCNLTIEKAAVSSSDGQLKGKYHKECFSCHTCHKPFPDKSFYVFDGKPFCAYHYHEANDSLCAATMCGQPIEGPCAVSHAGDRYHPEHLLCEYRGCTERLVEYWEVDGRMLCDRHAQRSEFEDDEEFEDDPTSRATKRVTRFIDLAAFNAGGGATGNSNANNNGNKDVDDEEESEIR
ncbi:hypothetical protein C8Q75DRAFT_801579 [Abortiporus biennis]|nr:hypothetical protein C8Q75DRAFT_801579 [Abortiporus biennis]